MCLFDVRLITCSLYSSIALTGLLFGELNTRSLIVSGVKTDEGLLCIVLDLWFINCGVTRWNIFLSCVECVRNLSLFGHFEGEMGGWECCK